MNATSVYEGEPRIGDEPVHAPGRRRRWLWLVAPIVFVVLFATFYPPAISIKDESVYLAQAYILRAGTVFTDLAHVSVIFGAVHNGHIAPVYPPGTGALLLPATLITWRAAFAVTAALQLIGFVLFRILLAQLGIRRGWAVLYLLFPSLVLFSRTLMSEVPSATFLLAALVLYMRGSRTSVVAAGAALGSLGFFRYANVIVAALFMAAALLQDLRAGEWPARARSPFRAVPRALPLVLGFLPATGLLIAYNVHTFGTLYGPPYRSVGHFGLGYIPSHLALYALVLTVIWPLMLFAPVLYRGRLRLEAAITGYGTLVAMSAWYYVDDAHGLAENLLTIPRLLLPVMPLWLAAYAGLADRLTREPRRYVWAVSTASAVGVIAMLGISIAHQRYLHQAEAVRQFIRPRVPHPTILLINDETSKFVGPAWGSPQFGHIAVLPRRPLTCPGVPAITVVYTAREGAPDPAGLGLTRATVRRVGATLVAYRALNTWSVAIWHRPAC